MKIRSTYLAGSFYDWREKVKSALPNHNFEDPSQHRQHCIAALVEDDMLEAGRCIRILVGLPRGKSLPTMTYAEVGAAKYAGNKILVVDENENKEPILNALANKRFSDFDSAIKYLRRVKDPNPNQNFPEPNSRNNDKGPVNRVLLLGFSEMFEKTLNEHGKVMNWDYDINNMGEFYRNTDLLVVNFERGNRPKKDILMMGVAYASQTPIIMCTANPIIYPPLAGLTRRIFVGDERFNILRDYLGSITSNEIGSEAKVMYRLFSKYNS